MNNMDSTNNFFIRFINGKSPSYNKFIKYIEYIHDEYGADADDFVNKANEILEDKNYFFLNDGTAIHDSFIEFLTSYGYI